MSGRIRTPIRSLPRLCRTCRPAQSVAGFRVSGLGFSYCTGRTRQPASGMMAARGDAVHSRPQTQSFVRPRPLTGYQPSSGTLSLVTTPVMPPAAPPGISPVLSPVTGTIPLDTKLLTYIELGAALGITPASAKRLAIRKGWPKKPGNDGRSRVSVPVEALPAEPPTVTSDTTGDDTGDIAGGATRDAAGDKSDAAMTVALLSDYIARVEGELEATKAKLETVERERDMERARAVQVDVLNAVLDVERRQAGELRAERDRALERLDLVQAEHVAELLALREQMVQAEHDKVRVAEALAAHLALPWWRRLLG